MAEEEAQVEQEEEEETEEQSEEPTAEAEKSENAPVPKPLTDEIKVIIVMKADNILLGVQNPDCDPVYTTMKGTMDEALGRVPGLVAEAKEKWATSPKNPEANLPKPAPTPVAARTATTTKSTAPKEQPSMF